MRLTILLVTLTISFCSWGQIFKLETSNPAPRVGEEITISCSLSKVSPDSIINNKGESWEDLLRQSENHIGDISLEISDWFLTESGRLKIGPFQIPINDKIYLTSELNVTVYPKLPEEIVEGIWVRLLCFQGEDYVILEQRTVGKETAKTDSNGQTTYSISTEDVNWASLNLEKIERMGIEISKNGSRGTIQTLNIGSALYMMTVYKYKTLTSFKGQLTIDKGLMINGPDKGHFEVTRVKN
jgi:hypothetical protein